MTIDKILRFLLNSQVVKFVIESSSVKHGEKLLSTILDALSTTTDTLLASVKNMYSKSEVDNLIPDIETPLVAVSTTGDVTHALDSGKWYRFSTIDSLTLTLNAVASGCVGTYFGRFTASSNWTDIAVPNGVIAAASNDTIESGKTYEFNIVDGIIKINEV